jgi:hypothetical protein
MSFPPANLITLLCILWLVDNTQHYQCCLDDSTRVSLPNHQQQGVRECTVEYLLIEGREYHVGTALLARIIRTLSRKQILSIVAYWMLRLYVINVLST